MRLVLSLALWLLAVPLITSWLYRVWIHRSGGFIERLTLDCLWGDIMSGLIITAAIILSFLSLMSFAGDYDNFPRECSYLCSARRGID